MKNLKVKKSDYIKYTHMHWEASKVGDHKTANKCNTKLTKIFKDLENDLTFAMEFLEVMLLNESYAVQSWAAAYYLGLGIMI